MAKTRGVRLSDETSAWVDEYAASRDRSASDVLRQAVESFKEDCEGGVPEIAPSPSPGPKPGAVAVDVLSPSHFSSRQAAVNAMIDKARGIR